jgi:hypothetical protein
MMYESPNDRLLRRLVVRRGAGSPALTQVDVALAGGHPFIPK